MPVLDASATLVGMVSRSDLLKPYLRADADIHREIAELVDAVGELDGVVAVRHRLNFRTDDIAGRIERPLL